MKPAGQSSDPVVSTMSVVLLSLVLAASGSNVVVLVIVAMPLEVSALSVVVVASTSCESDTTGPHPSASRVKWAARIPSDKLTKRT
jgi:hypothetical protein